MRRSVLVLIIAVLAVVIADTAQAWEFSMTGEYELRYRYISRTGRYDLFGDAQAAQSNIGSGTSIGLAGPNNLSLRLEGFSS